MVNTAAGREHSLSLENLAGCVALSQAARWNQNAADWTMMLGAGHGWGISLEDGTLAASTLVLPYGSFAWISMVLVHPAHRRKGYATTLLRRALDDLQARGLTPVLDATPDGREVYRQEGFRDTWGFARLALAAPTRDAGARDAGGAGGVQVRALAVSDWPALLALDARAFGARRETLLRALATRLPEAALVAEDANGHCGYLLGRDGREARQLGPLVARGPAAARALLAQALRDVPAPVYLDLVDRERDLRTWLEARGFALQRPFTRMVHQASTAGTATAPGDARLVVCPAGPELG